jgi:hypothetical protein
MKKGGELIWEVAQIGTIWGLVLEKNEKKRIKCAGFAGGRGRDEAGDRVIQPS